MTGTIAPMPPVNLLIVEDDAPVRQALVQSLREFAADTLEASSAREALTLASRERVDALILDLGLPDGTGLDVCRAVRAFSSVPIIVISARHEEQEKIALLDAGADDYVTKPFSTAELLARLRAHVRRSREGARGASPIQLELGRVRVDLDRRLAEREGEPLTLTPTEWTLLRVLVSQRGRTLTHKQLFAAVWNREYGDASLHLRVHLTHLRRKLEPDPATPRYILTDPGVGYRFEMPEPPR